MQLKPLIAIRVLLLMGASLLISGCTTSTTDQTPSASTATHDIFLEKYIAADNNYTYTEAPFGNVTSWRVTWINGTSARVVWTAVSQSGNETGTVTYDITHTLLSTTQDATKYLNATNKTSYTLSSSNYSEGPYKTVTGHAPEVFKVYSRTEGTLGKSGYALYGIRQEDNIVSVLTAKMVITSS
jgi:hypothetical protein